VQNVFGAWTENREFAFSVFATPAGQVPGETGHIHVYAQACKPFGADSLAEWAVIEHRGSRGRARDGGGAYNCTDGASLFTNN